jgi:hypothetical protein
MTLPVLPPIFLRVLPTVCVALAIAEPADDVTLEIFCEPSEAAGEAVFFALEATSDEEDVCLTGALRKRNRDCRRTARDAATGMLRTGERKRRQWRGMRGDILDGG